MPYPVTAGVGPFDVSLVDPFFEQVVDTGRARLQLAPIYYLVANPLLSTTISSAHGSNTRCPRGADECVSVLLSGGLEMARAQGSNSSLAGNGTREDVHEPPSESDFPMAKLDSVQSLQVDYTWPASDAFEPGDCQVPTNTSVKLCVSEVGDGSVRAAIFDCPWPKDESKPRCTERSMPNITGTVSFWTRKATVLVSRSNYSIAGLEDLTARTLTSHLFPDHPPVSKLTYQSVRRRRYYSPSPTTPSIPTAAPSPGFSKRQPPTPRRSATSARTGRMTVFSSRTSRVFLRSQPGY